MASADITYTVHHVGESGGRVFLDGVLARTGIDDIFGVLVAEQRRQRSYANEFIVTSLEYPQLRELAAAVWGERKAVP